ncbi:alpha-1,6-mannosylglycoprotein 6-beta-N-acetylglucosaminyltransferase A-like [Actinia tenebrosa]|uniref:alpha-1,6-mannosyl-glycoprotein 6-beta-N-acetylglucosaminyltransferase n=1 Tax=Actinia tenebrosa TaxID=6105 RepID=A0A6P8HT61_ACTTE|nr:alpha-1,6-mannosylglycoprotein 6-beta-N-acetylglucosaminyltransferase A-like [Actinia tenebrosa]
MQRQRHSFKLTSHRVGVILILLSFIWGLYLIKIQLDERSSQPDYLKARIIQLSREYIKALAREKSLGGIDGQVPKDVEDMKKATAVLLQSMMDRIHILEIQVESVIVNSTQEFQNLANQIKSLNSSIYNGNRTTVWEDKCVIPNDPSYPECLQKFNWLEKNWKKDPRFAKHGVNGSRCSILKYLSEVEAWCPKPQFNCEIPNDSAFPHCSAKVQWMRKYWTSDPKFRGHGVDGSDCSILYYLSEVENWCPSVAGHTSVSDCAVPNNPSHPSCMAKVAWMRNFWKSDACYAKDYGVNGTICSFLVYLSEVENWCPLLPGRARPTVVSTKPLLKPNFHQKELSGLLTLLDDKNAIKFRWIKTRITRMWPAWREALKFLKSNRDSSKDVRKKILIHIGVLASESTLHFAENAYKGGPLGELVQWSDLISSLYLLGHDITVSADINKLQQALGSVKHGRKNSCPIHISDDFDLIYLDYYGIRQLISKIGSLMPYFKCKFRILDSFGTEAQFNYAGFTEKIPGGSMGLWGRHNLNLRQFMTMFPHSPDNSFLGFVVGEKPPDVKQPKKKKPRALVYGKHFYMWKDLKNKEFLNIINKYLEIHATVGGANDFELRKYIPSFVINHGVLPAAEVQSLLQQSMVFVGLGFPYEGPAPLEAIANGCFYLNPKFTPPRNRLNTPFFKDKPTLRKITSQHPYTEEYISKPYVYTIDIDNDAEVEEVLKAILVSEPVKPYMPFEFTHEGMLERLHEFVQKQDFCGQSHWPPIETLRPIKGDISKSCKETCHEKEMVCEPEFFQEINLPEQLTRAGFPCNTTRSEDTPSLVAPGYREDPPACLLQAQPLLFSCTATSPSTSRLCPCRDFKKGQVALCKSC